jgi:hypothetical protein
MNNVEHCVTGKILINKTEIDLQSDLGIILQLVITKTNRIPA